VRKDDLKRRVEPALYQVMEPGDQIVGGTLAMTGSMTWDTVAGALAIVAVVTGTAGLIGAANPSVGLAFGVGLASLALFPLQLRRKPVFVAVTRREIICYRLSRMRFEPVRLLFRAPLAAVQVGGARRALPGWRSFRYSGPGAEGRGLRLNVHWRWGQEVDEVVSALQAGGAAVEGVPFRPQPSSLPAP